MKVFFTQAELTLIQSLLIRELRKYKQMLVDNSNVDKAFQIGYKIELLRLIIHKITCILGDYEHED